MELLLETNLPNLYYRGKVRDTYDLGDRLFIETVVTSIFWAVAHQQAYPQCEMPQDESS